MGDGTGIPFGARASMEPCGVALRYRMAEGGNSASVERNDFESFDDGAVALDAAFDGETIELAVTPRVPVRLERVEVRLRHAFATDEFVLMNGYQSWTDTVERPPFARMRGLAHVPRPIVKRFAIDAGGDYAFAPYPTRRGVQHGFTYATFRRGEGLVLVGSLDEAHGFTLIESDASAGLVTLATEPPAHTVDAGERIVAGRFAICRGTEDAAYDRYFELAGIRARPVLPLVGYTSWYRHYGSIDEPKLRADLAGMRTAGDGGAGMPGVSDSRETSSASGIQNGPNTFGPPHESSMFDNSRMPKAPDAEHDGGAPHAPGAFNIPDGPDAAAGREVQMLFQIDDGYCRVGDWLDVDRVKFPNGLATLARAIRDAGFLPGLWIAPFVCERDSRLFRERPEWLLRDEAGDPVRSGPQWSGGYALDTRNVEVRSYVLDALRTMTCDWGFGLLKIDFLYAACIRAHDGLNRGELMADALQLVRTGAGEDTLILGCGVPLASAFGVVDYCRIGCDVGLDWDDAPHMRLLHRERVSTKNSLGNTYARSPLDGRAFGNDPDVFFLRDDVKLSQAQRDELLFADADLGSVLLTSDDRAAWDDAARQRYAEALNVFARRHCGGSGGLLGEGDVS